MTELAGRTGLAPATVHRMLSTLLKLGWIERDPRSSRYELSGRMIGNAALAVANSPLLNHGYPLLQRLTDATGLNSFLAVLVSRGSVLLARVHGQNGTTLDFQIGKVLPLHASASGKVFLANLTRDGARRVPVAAGRPQAHHLEDADRHRVAGHRARDGPAEGLRHGPR